MKYLITRDKDGELKLQQKTERYPFLVDDNNDGMWCGRHIQLDGDLFPEILYGQDPVEVEINIKIKKEDDNSRLSKNEVSEEQPSEIS